MDPFSQLSQLQQNLQAMTKTVAGLENDMLDVLKENTELKVENQLLREKISKLDANKEPAESKSQAGLNHYVIFTILAIIFATCIMALTVNLVKIACFA